MNVLILKKNGKSAKLVADTEANLLDLYKLIDDLILLLNFKDLNQWYSIIQGMRKIQCLEVN